MFEMSMSQEMELRVTPALLNLAHMLALPNLALHTLVQQELSDNPALEEIDIDDETELTELSSLADALRDIDVGNEAYDDYGSGSLATRDETIDPLLFVSAPLNLAESLLSDLHTCLPAREHPIALFVVGNLDEHGFLQDDPESLAHTLDVSLERVAHVIKRLQEIGPPGIATRTTRDCLLAQIDALAASGVTCPYVRVVVSDYLDNLGAHRYKQIAQQLHIRIEDVEAVRAFIREHLWPYPMQSALHTSSHASRPRYSQPDVSITERQGKFTVEVLHSPRRRLRLSPLYRDLARQATTLEEADREHVQDYITRARTFLANLRQRESTLQQIAETVVTYQEEFLRHGVRHLAPLTRAEISAQTGLHESTVSRATSDKTVLLPNGSTMPFSNFFVSALGVQDVIRELIENETEPLSDAELARLLNARGYQLARRTVAKYREQMQILPSTLR